MFCTIQYKIGFKFTLESKNRVADLKGIVQTVPHETVYEKVGKSISGLVPKRKN